MNRCPVCDRPVGDAAHDHGPHRPPGCCQFCGTALNNRARCPGCGTDRLLDCRPHETKVDCEHDPCFASGVIGVDLHDTFDGEEHFWCSRHCPTCRTEEVA